MLTSVTSLRVLSYNYSSFPLSLLASRASPSPTYIKHAQTRTLWTHGRHSPLQTIIFLQARWTYLHNTTFFSLSSLPLFFAFTPLRDYCIVQPFCDIKDDTTSELWLEGLTQHSIDWEWCTYYLPYHMCVCHRSHLEDTGYPSLHGRVSSKYLNKDISNRVRQKSKDSGAPSRCALSRILRSRVCT